MQRQRRSGGSAPETPLQEGRIDGDQNINSGGHWITTARKRKDDSEYRYNPTHEPLSIPKRVLDTILKHDNAMDMIALFTFYYYTAKWQSSLQPRATVSYAAKGLKCSQNRVRRAKKNLIEIGMVESIKRRDPKKKFILEHYIKVNFVSLNNNPPQSNKSNSKSHRTGNLHYGKAYGLENHETNALTTNSLNALTTNKRNASSAEAPDGDTSDAKVTLQKVTSPDEQLITPNMFDSFWKIYPRRVDKGKALTKWETICRRPQSKRPTWKTIQSAIEGQKQSERWQDKKFIPYPATWLNQQRWLDDPKEMKGYNNGNGNGHYPVDMAQTPEEVMEAAGRKDLIRFGLKPALELVEGPPADKVAVARNICRYYEWYDGQQRPNRVFEEDMPDRNDIYYHRYSQWLVIPNARRFLESYISWLRNQGWLKRIEPRHFDHNNAVFQKFFDIYQHDENYNFFTGKRYYNELVEAVQ